MVEEIQYIESGEDIEEKVLELLTNKKTIASDEDFETKLRGPLYESNRNVTRFILNKLCDKHKNTETKSAWEVNKNGKPLWTIEHILPQNEELCEEWVDMIANGNKEEAAIIQEKYVHVMGNLTLSGNNSSLSDRPFIEKRDMKKGEVYIGYQNNLWLNNDLKDANKWTTEEIEERNEVLIEETLDLFKF